MGFISLKKSPKGQIQKKEQYENPHKFPFTSISLSLSLVFCIRVNAEQDIAQGYFARHYQQNPAFLDRQNAFRLEFAPSLYGGHFENYHITQITYSQPNHPFRLHGRVNLELAYIFAGNKRYHEFNQPIFGLSEDIILPIYSKDTLSLYAGLGIGAYIKDGIERRVGSRFTFGERVFVGVLFEGLVLEIIARHLSNGTIELPNDGHNFIGLNLGIVF